MTEREIDRMDAQQRMILENQAVIMTTLIALLGKHGLTDDLYYHTAKTKAYIGPRPK